MGKAMLVDGTLILATVFAIVGALASGSTFLALLAIVLTSVLVIRLRNYPVGCLT